MDREVLQKRINRNHKNNKYRRYGKIAVCVVLIVLLTVIIWNVAKPVAKGTVRSENIVSGTEAVQTETTEPSMADGSGACGTALLSDDKVVSYATPGWQVNDYGWWYAPSEDTYSYNGWFEDGENTYHLDANGYMDVGWTAIGGKGCYFDENGVYDPSADGSKMIALTFDDGPSIYTSQLLDLLQTYDAKASFMMLGYMVEKNGADTIPRMVELGCTIGNHSYDHADLLNYSVQDAMNDFVQCDNVIAQYNNGCGASVIRFPYGDYTEEQSAATGRPNFLWDVDSLDWESMNAEMIYNQVLDNVEGGTIILLHDIYQSTIDACAMLIPELQKEGYELVNLETLAAARGYELTPGVTYFSFKDLNIEQNRVTNQGY